jgi:hypothetical protein
VGRQAPRSGRLRATVARIGSLLDARPPGRRDCLLESLDDMARKQTPAAPRTVSGTLRAAIAGRGLTAYAVARMTGVDTSVVARFLAGERGLSMKSLDRLCEALELELRPSPGAPGGAGD